MAAPENYETLKTLKLPPLNREAGAGSENSKDKNCLKAGIRQRGRSGIS